MSSAYTKNNSINLHLDYNYNPFTSDAGRTGLPGSTVSCTNGVASKAEIYSEYGRPHGTELSEIVKVQVLLHEMVHSDNDLKKIKTPNHTGFDRESVLKGLIEYNNTNNLGYSKEDLEIISWIGLEKSDEFKEYIKQKSENSGRTLDEEKQSFENNLNMLRINQGPNTEKNE